MKRTLLILAAGCVLTRAAAGQDRPAESPPAPPSPSAPAAGAALGPGGIVAFVGTEVITQGELDKKLEAHQARFADESQRAHYRRQLLEFLIQQQLLLQKAKRLNITAEEPEIDFYVHKKIEEWRRKDFEIRDEEDYYRILQEREGISREAYRDEIRKAVLMEKLLWTHVFPAQDFVTPGEKREYYQTHIEEFQTPSEITFRQIYLSPTEQSIAVMEVIDKALENETPFAEVAAAFSESAREEGGLWVKKFNEVQRWPEPLPRLLRSMKPGQIVKRIRTSRGFHYLQMESIESGETQPFSEVQEQIEERIRTLSRERKREAFLEKLKKDFVVKILVPDAVPPAAAAAKAPAAEPAEGGVKDVSPEPGKAPAKKDRKDPPE